MWERCTDRAKKILELADAAAVGLHHEAVEAEHLLLGLVREGTGVGAAVLRHFVVALDDLEARVLARMPPGRAVGAGGRLPLAGSAERALELAGRESTGLRSGYVGSEHLLLGLMGDPSSGASRVLRDTGLDLDAVRGEIRGRTGSRRPVVRRIVSGGQTGVDRAALDIAIEFGIEHGGWCPRGRRAEDGAIPVRYLLRETTSADYEVRTRQNVVDADGTLILTRGNPRGGTAFTLACCREWQRPHCVVELDRPPHLAIEQAVQWLLAQPIAVLNVAGPRESTAPGIGAQAANVLRHVMLQARR